MAGEPQRDLEDLRDPTSGRLVPRNTDEWNRIRAALGWPLIWEPQQTSGNLADSIGSFASSPKYLQSVDGWTRKGRDLNGR